MIALLSEVTFLDWFDFLLLIDDLLIINLFDEYETCQ